MKEIASNQIEDWLYKDELSDRTKLNFFRVLKNYFGHALRLKYIAENPMATVTMPHPDDSVPHVLTVAQCEALLLAAHGDSEAGLLPYVALGMFCGIRREELTKLQWSHIDLGKR